MPTDPQPERPAPKFTKGQIVVMKSLKRALPFRILDVKWAISEWCYAWNRKNYAAEHMLRALTDEEIGR